MTDPSQIQQLAQLLLAAQQSNPEAEKQLNAFKESNLGNYFQGLVSVLATDGINTDPLARQLAGLLIKNALKPLHSTEHALQTQYHDSWKQLDPAIRDSVKGPLLTAMRNPEAGVSHPAAQAAAEVAAIELPFDQWPAFLPTLLENIRGEYAENIKVATLECLGYCCERISFLGGEVNQASTDSMLSAIVDGIGASRPNRMRQAAAGALKNSLMFAATNMEKQEERGAIMNALMEATRSDDANVRIVAYDGIVQIAVLYYTKLQEYMTNFYQLTTNTIKQDNEEVGKAAIEFWTSLCEVEQDLIDEEAECRQRGLPVERPCMRYVDAAMQHLAPFLFETLQKQSEDPDVDDFTLHMAGQLCLASISQTVEDNIVPIVMPFVNSNIQDPNWRNRDAAIMAFISILDGPSAETIGTYVAQSVSPLLNMLNDENITVRDSAAHCISRICLLHVQCIPQDAFPTLLQELTTKCSDGSPKVASQAATAIFNLASAFSDQGQDEDQPSNALSPYMQILLQKLLEMVDRQDADDDTNLRLAGMEAISELISVSAQDNLPILSQLLPNFITRFEQASAMPVLNEDDKNNKEQIQGLLCAVIQNLYRKLDKATVMPMTDKVMTLLLQVLSVKNSSCHEECFTAISAISDAMEGDFVKYMQAFEPCLVAGLRNFQAYQVCIVAVGTVGDISRNIEGAIQPFCDNIMNALVDDLKDSTIHRSVKPPVLSCFGDIAMAIGGAYKPYLEFSVLMLMQASATTVPDEDLDLVEYLNLLREAILEAYVGIIQGLRDGNLLGDFLPYVPSILQFLQVIAEDPNRDSYVLNKAVGLLGDLAQTMGPQIKDEFNKQFVQKLIGDAMSSPDPSLVEVATWASQLLTQAVQMA